MFIPKYQRFSMEKLCAASTGLRFIMKSSHSDEIINSDLLDVNSNRYSLLFHLVLSVKMNPSLIILNNTILGVPTDELQEIIHRFRKCNELQDLFDDTHDKYRQVIVVDRSERSYRTRFKCDFHGIRGSKVNGQPIIDENERSN